MKEVIYTIPVNEVFSEKCECPLCELESRFEKESVDYYLGPSLMDPDNRIETNKSGFCKRHYQEMYKTQTNRLGLGLMVHTHLQEQIKILSKLMKAKDKSGSKSLFSKEGPTNKVSSYLEGQLEECSICKKLNFTMDRYYEVIFHLYSREDEFKRKFNEGLGFCLPHFKDLIDKSDKHLRGSMREEFLDNLYRMELEHLERLEKEVDWFTKKFDYRNSDEPWGSSKDALIRTIKKVSGVKELE